MSQRILSAKQRFRLATNCTAQIFDLEPVRVGRLERDPLDLAAAPKLDHRPARMPGVVLRVSRIIALVPATSATNLQQGQSVVVSTLQQKFNSTSEVSIDNEMSNLIALQNSYSANAHVMSVVQTMMQTLLQAQIN